MGEIVICSTGLNIGDMINGFKYEMNRFEKDYISLKIKRVSRDVYLALRDNISHITDEIRLTGEYADFIEMEQGILEYIDDIDQYYTYNNDRLKPILEAMGQANELHTLFNELKVT